MVWWEVSGGAHLELFSVVGDQKILINDSGNVNAIKAYVPSGTTVDESISESNASTGRAYISSIYPEKNANVAGDARRVVEVEITNGARTQVAQGSVGMVFDGETVTPNVAQSGDVVTVLYEPNEGFASGSHTVTVTFEENTTPPSERSFTLPFSVEGEGGGTPVLVSAEVTLTGLNQTYDGSAKDSHRND